MLCTELVVPPTIRKAWAAPKASAASSSASRITDTGWQRLSSGFMLFTSTPTHCWPRKAVSSGLPRPRLWPGTSKGTTRIRRKFSSASWIGARRWSRRVRLGFPFIVFLRPVAPLAKQKNARPHFRADLRCLRPFSPQGAPSPGRAGARAAACFGRIVSRVYIAILLLLLLLTVSQVCVGSTQFLVIKGTNL